jgi:two-component system, cell cycle sensor histidine kinase and response regulator CckA
MEKDDMKMPLRVLFVEDSDEDSRLVLRELTKGGYDVTAVRVETADALRDALSGPPWDAVICDYTLPSFDALEALRMTQASGLDPVFIVVSGTIGEETAVEVLKAGAHDFIVKGQLARLLPAMTRALGEAQRRREHHRSEQMRRANETRFHQVVEASNDCIWETDGQGRFTYLSPQCRDLMGYEPQELIGTALFDLVDPDDVGRIREAFESLRTDRDQFRGLEHRSRYKNGRVLVVESNCLAVKDEPGTLCGYRGLTRDVTERKRLEEQVRQAQKMEAVGTLAGGIAHDFNNLLTTILGYAGLALRGLQPTDPLARDIREIQDAANQAALLTRRLLAFSRKETVVPQVLDLPRVVEGMESMLSRMLGEDIALTIQGNGTTVRADRGQIEQVIMNLAVNAHDAMLQGGCLTIDTADMTVAVGDPTNVPSGSYVVLTVSDDGAGMDAATQSRAFEPFFTTKPVGHGTGLGLSTVYGIVTQCGGHVRVSSEVGKGTTFRVYLPRVEERSTPPVVDAPSGSVRTGSETVLVAEDEEPVRRLMRETLAGAGYTVLEAGDGAEALTLCDQNRGKVRLVITDVVMPRLDGAALGEWIMSVDPSVKVLFVSGYAEGLLERKGIQLAAAGFLGKPFTAEALLLKVREALDDGRPAGWVKPTALKEG